MMHCITTRLLCVTSSFSETYVLLFNYFRINRDHTCTQRELWPSGGPIEIMPTIEEEDGIGGARTSSGTEKAIRMGCALGDSIAVSFLASTRSYLRAL